MKGLIRFSLSNPYAVIVMALTIAVLGVICLENIPVDILPVFKSPAVQVLTFYQGMPARGIEKDITIRMERWTGQANGMRRQESRSIIGASIVQNMFQPDVDQNGALTEVNSLALAVIPNLPPGTLPPVVLRYDPTATTPVALVVVKSRTEPEQILYDVGRYEVRNMIMQIPGASAPVVIGGKLRAVLLYLKETEMQARGLSPAQIMKAVDNSNLFFPAGDVKIGPKDFSLYSNSMYDTVERMRDIPLNTEPGKFEFLRDVADPQDSSFIQTNIVRVDNRKQVYIPVYRQVGSSTLAVVEGLKKSLPDMKGRLSRSDIDLELVMDQSVYVKESIGALEWEGTLGAILCSLVILFFLGQWRMTLIAILTLPLSVLMAIICLKYTNQTINVMTLAGLTLAIGPMIDSAIICLENTERYLRMGAPPKEAAVNGTSEVAMPSLVATLCTFLVLAPLAFMPGMGRFLFLPMFLAVMFAMTTVYALSLTLVPCFSAYLLKPYEMGMDEPKTVLGRVFAWWEKIIDRGIHLYGRALEVVLKHRGKTIAVGFGALLVTATVLIPIMRRDFFPEVDSGAFEIAARAPSGTKLEITEGLIAQVEDLIKQTIPPEDLKLVISEIGVTADWSAAYTPNSGPQDAILKIQLTPERSKTSQEYIRSLRDRLAKDPRFTNLEFSFDSGGLIRGALNEGKSSPINIQLTGKNQDLLFPLADKIRDELAKIDGIVDCRVIQRPDAPELTLEVDRAKAAQLGLTQADVMQNVIAATNSSITFNKKNFWIDPVSHNQYFVGVQYSENKIKDLYDLYKIRITSPSTGKSIPLANVATIHQGKVPTEIHHVNIQSAIDLTMNVEWRDLGHVSEDVADVLHKFGEYSGNSTWATFDPRFPDQQKQLEGSKIVFSGEYRRMRTTFGYLVLFGLLAIMLIYFLMVALDKSFIVPLAVMLVVPLCLVGILPMLFLTGSAINVQSLLGFIFIVGIKVANTVLMTDYAQELRRHEGLSPIDAIRKAARLRVRPVTMTALAAFFAMVPTALALEKGSEANAPLARAILGGLLAGEPATLFVLPALYAVLVRDKKKPDAEQNRDPLPAHG
jgi:multidrug efflux pump subunit AcrB